jgi:hypothetical protein
MIFNNVFGDVPESITRNLRAARFIEVPGTNPLHYRPISVNNAPGVLADLQNVTRGGLQIDEASLREIASDIVSPSRQSQGTIGIFGGWDERRCSVFLDFEIISGAMSYREILTCYTDTAQISHAGVAGDIRIFPNSVIRVAESRRRTPHGPVVQMRAEQNVQVLNPIAVQLNGQAQLTESNRTMRVSDLLTGYQNIVAGVPEDAYDDRNLASRDTVSGVGVAASRMTNGISSNFLSSAMTSYSQATANNDNGLSTNDRYVLGTAASHARETELTGCQIFSMLKERTSYSMTGFFTWQELLGAVNASDPNGLQVHMLPPTAPLSMANDMQTWGDYSDETMIAHKLTHAIPAICTQTLTSVFQFRATMDPINGHVVLPQNYQAVLDGLNEAAFSQSLISALQNAILPEIFPATKVGTYVIDVNYVVGGDMIIHVELDGSGITVPYSLPCYCDSLASSVMALDQRTVLNNGQKLGEVVTGNFTAVDPSAATRYA